MKLQITVDETILENLFKPPLGDTHKINCVSRINSHTLVSSKKLQEFWESHADSKGYIEQYGDWLNSIISDPSKFKKVTIPETSKVISQCSDREKVILDTCYASDDKIAVGNYSGEIRSKDRDIKYVDSNTFGSSKKTRISMTDIENTMSGSNPLKKNLFDIYETPIHVDIVSGQPSKLLADYLAVFYKDADELIIQDMYIPSNQINEDNLSNYVLPYINKKKCKIEFIFSKQDNTQKKRFTDYDGYLTTVKFKDGRDIHSGFIQTPKYRITMNYRLYTFGNAGRTSTDTISITKR